MCVTHSLYGRGAGYRDRTEQFCTPHPPFHSITREEGTLITVTGPPSDSWSTVSAAECGGGGGGSVGGDGGHKLGMALSVHVHYHNVVG